MLPIGPMMVEHRLIERMIYIIKDELKTIQEKREINPIFIDNAVDFIRTYADQTHHGKEEDILFRYLSKKKMSKEHKKIMNELIEEHKFGRKTTKELLEAKEKFILKDKNAINIIIEKLKLLTDFYPKHIEKEDKQFFIPVMEYFTKEEQNAMLKEGQVFDRRMIHRKYNTLLIKYEREKDLFKKDQKLNWIDYM
jgi:hemerythrin-like domain-containing protein